MKPSELRAIRKRAGLSQKALAELFRMAPSAARRVRHWEAGDYPPPGPVTICYEMLDDGRLKPAEGDGE